MTKKIAKTINKIKAESFDKTNKCHFVNDIKRCGKSLAINIAIIIGLK